VALLWFDTPINMTPERAQRFVDLVRELQPDCLINGRLGAKPGAFDYISMGDNAVPDHVVEGAWETPATINGTWGYKKNDHFSYQKPTGRRCTAKPGKLYIHLFDWPTGSFRLEDLKGKVTGPRLLPAPQRKLKFKQQGSTLVVSLPRVAPSAWANVLALDAKGEAR
jgi:hypothetical protein